MSKPPKPKRVPTLPHAGRARVFGQVSFEEWRWKLVEEITSPTVRVLEQDGAPPTNVYAIGSVLSAQARLIAALGPPALVEVDQAFSLGLDATEHLEVVAAVLGRHLRRAYRLRQQEHYADLGILVKTVGSAISALQQSASEAQHLLDELELAEAKSRNGQPVGPANSGA